VLEKIWDTGLPILDRRLTITLLINILSMTLIIMIAVPAGIYSAVKPHSLFDRCTTVFVFVGFATPAFWLALVLMLLFSVQLDWLPISGIKSMDYARLSFFDCLIDRVRHLILPVFISAFGGIAGMSRYMRSSMLEAIRNDYITTARAKGLPERSVIYRHALRNALLPLITILGLSIPGLISGSVIFEWIFGIPGMGQLSFQSIMSRDYPVIMGLLVISSILTMLGNLTADIGYAVADPRIRTR
jgi:peptide/nickel transport system permease protein